MNGSNISEIKKQRPSTIFYSLLTFFMAIAVLLLGGLQVIIEQYDKSIFVFYMALFAIISGLFWIPILKGRSKGKILYYLLLLIVIMGALSLLQQSEHKLVIFEGGVVLVLAILSGYYQLSAKSHLWFKACKLARKGKLPDDYQQIFFEPVPKKTETSISPWARFWARHIDMYIYCLTTGACIGIISALNHTNYELPSTIVLMVLTLPFCAIVETILLSLFGTTPGKAILNIKIRQNNDQKLTFINSLKRSFRVYIQGFWLGLPLLSFISQIFAYSRLTKDGITSWDESYNLNVTQGEIGWFRKVIAISIIVLIYGIVFITKLSEN